VNTDDTAEIAAWRTLLEAHAAVVDLLAKEMKTEAGLALGWYEVLLYLEESPQGRLRMHELADSLLLSRSAVTRFVDRMERAGLVSRSACSSDRRGQEVVMTDAGRALFRKAGRIHLRGIREHFVAHLRASEAAVVERVMRRIAAAAKAGPQGEHAA
jgi:DNA-binding MarR family transcriptional regulator